MSVYFMMSNFSFARTQMGFEGVTGFRRQMILQDDIKSLTFTVCQVSITNMLNCRPIIWIYEADSHFSSWCISRRTCYLQEGSGQRDLCISFEKTIMEFWPGSGVLWKFFCESEEEDCASLLSRYSGWAFSKGNNLQSRHWESLWKSLEILWQHPHNVCAFDFTDFKIPLQ